MAHRRIGDVCCRSGCGAMVLSDALCRPGGGAMRVNWDKIEDASIAFAMIALPTILLICYLLLWLQ